MAVSDKKWQVCTTWQRFMQTQISSPTALSCPKIQEHVMGLAAACLWFTFSKKTYRNLCTATSFLATLSCLYLHVQELVNTRTTHLLWAERTYSVASDETFSSNRRLSLLHINNRQQLSIYYIQNEVANYLDVQQWRQGWWFWASRSRGMLNLTWGAQTLNWETRKAQPSHHGTESSG
jgi:hypothetical protein